MDLQPAQNTSVAPGQAIAIDTDERSPLERPPLDSRPLESLELEAFRLRQLLAIAFLVGVAAMVVIGLAMIRINRPPSMVSIPPAAIDINLATADQLQAVPGIGPKLAQAVIDYRGLHGNFTDLESLTEVPDIGEATLSKIRPHLVILAQPSQSGLGSVIENHADNTQATGPSIQTINVKP